MDDIPFLFALYKFYWIINVLDIIGFLAVSLYSLYPNFPCKIVEKIGDNKKSKQERIRSANKSSQAHNFPHRNRDNGLNMMWITIFWFFFSFSRAHNLLCDRCAQNTMIVLDKGGLIFWGLVAKGILKAISHQSPLSHYNLSHT